MLTFKRKEKPDKALMARIFRVIDSCTTLEHVESARAYTLLWLRRYAGWEVGWMGPVLAGYCRDKAALIIIEERQQSEKA
jgi:hypothetical protein